MKALLVLPILLCVCLCVQGQLRKQQFSFPNAGEYMVLKADFHQHTVFSDGQVWPTVRVVEAYEEDLDIIALSEHIEYRPHLNEFISHDHNHSFDLAQEEAKRYGVLLIRSAEVTRAMAPGHLNVIDIKDANPLEKFVNKQDSRDASTVIETLEEARRQGGFIFWNHTAYPSKDNKSHWYPIHETLKNKGLMMGIEIVNGERYEPIAFQWCLDYNLTILANTDVHTTMAQKRSADNFKVMTLVLAKEKTKEAVMDALREHRTVALWNNQLMGRKEHVETIVGHGVVVRLTRVSEEKGLFEIENLTGMPFVFEFQELPEGFSIRNDVPCLVKENSVSALGASFKNGCPKTVKVKVKNVYVTPEQNLEMELPLVISER